MKVCEICGLILFCLLFSSFIITVGASSEIQIWCDTQFDPVSPFLFGSGDEMDEDFSPLEGVTELIGVTSVPILRMGGISNEYYDWEGNNYNGVKYLDVLDTLIISQNCETSMDDFLQMCEELQIVPVLSVNFQLNDPAKASRLVEYCNGDETTSMGQIRASRGHPAPYNVVYWQIGNEPDISGVEISLGGYILTAYRHFGIPFNQWHWSDSVFATPTLYAELAKEYTTAMRSSSPIPLLIDPISLGYDMDWLEATITECGDDTDWLDIHYYPCSSWGVAPPDTTDYIQWLSSPDIGSTALENWYQAMLYAITTFNDGTPIPLGIMEYNALIVNSDPVWWNYLDGLFVADCMGHLARVGCPMAGAYSIFEGSPDDPYTSFGMIRGDTLSMRATAWVTKLFNNNFTGTVVEATSDAAGGGYGLEVHATLREDGKLCLIAVNKLLNDEVEANISLNGYTSSGYAALMDITNDAPMDAPSNGTTGIQTHEGIWGTSNTFQYTFPKASVTCLLIYPAGSWVQNQPDPSSVFTLSPTPVTENLSIGFSLNSTTQIQIDLFDCSGRLLESIVNEEMNQGIHSLIWNRGELPNGTYLLLMRGDGQSFNSRKIVVN